MINDSHLEALQKVFVRIGAGPFLETVRLTGGCINDCFKVVTGRAIFFAKINKRSDMLLKEAAGLRALSNACAIDVPEIIHVGDQDEFSVLILSFIEEGKKDKDFWENFGRDMAALHQTTSSHFGYEHDNYIGSLVQRNALNDEWINFFIKQRLEPQLDQAEKKGRLGKQEKNDFEKLYKKLPGILPKCSPSLLHGDFWSGNFISNSGGRGTILDPAVYFGCHEVDLAMSRLFGGFDSDFYDAYFEVFPVEPGFNERVDIYNLYPLLVHVNLFGGGYLSSVKTIVKAYL